MYHIYIIQIYLYIIISHLTLSCVSNVNSYIPSQFPFMSDSNNREVSSKTKLNVAVIGGGSWGTAVVRRIALNCKEQKETKDLFNPIVKLWLKDEIVNGESLVEIINRDKMNTKYMPNILLPDNVIATGNLADAIIDMDVLIMVIPHQFLGFVLRDIKELNVLKADTIAISLTKGINVLKTGPQLLTDMISNELNLHSVGALMGANLAHEVAQDDFVEATVATTTAASAELIKTLFTCDVFNIQTSADISTVELCGALKNIVAMGAGFSNALNYGMSTKSAIIRQGIQEMNEFCKLCIKSSDNFDPNVILGSCGVSDVIASSLGGRNARCSEEFIKRVINQRSDKLNENDARELWVNIEKELLNGQMLQGLTTCDEVIECLKYFHEQNIVTPKFPLFNRIYEISRKNADPKTLTQWR